jgi:hypothetical protein
MTLAKRADPARGRDEALITSQHAILLHVSNTVLGERAEGQDKEDGWTVARNLQGG